MILFLNFLTRFIFSKDKLVRLEKGKMKYFKFFHREHRKIGKEILPLKCKKAGRFMKLLGIARSHFIVTRGLVSLSCATTPHPSCFSKS